MKTIYYNGEIYTGSLPLQEAFAAEAGRILACGSSREMLEMAESGDELVDLGGCFVCPGFHDSHMHLLNYGQTLSGARLGENTDSLAGLLAYLKNFLAENPPRPGQWLKGRGWNQDYFRDEKRMPARRDLDQVSADIPVMITRACGHSCVVNSAVLQLAGIDRHTPDPEGGAIGRDEEGEPDGRLYENAIEMLNPVMPQPGPEDIKDMLRRAIRAVHAYGITGVQSDDYSTFRGVPWQIINQAYRELEAAGELSLDVTEQCNFTELGDLQAFLEVEDISGVGGDFFRIGPLKLLGDGSLGSRTAHLSMPYLGTEERGFSLFTPEHLKTMIGTAHARGMQVAVHAIGDACLEEVLDAIEEALQAHPRGDHRHGIVHCQISRPEQLERMARLGLHIYAQSIFLDYDNHIVEKLVPPELAGSSYSWKSLMKQGVTVSNGSDCPVELPDVMAGIQCAVTRCSLDGTGPYLPGEAFTVQEALDSFTKASARAVFREGISGALQPGYQADFVILSQNPFRTEPEKLHEIQVLATYHRGKRVFIRK